MIWDDKGFLISKFKYNENSVIADFFTSNHGRCSGIIFGATSKKIKNYLLIGNKFHLNFNFKQDSKLGYFKVEIDEIMTPLHLENKKKLFCIIYTMNIIKILTVENEENKNIYDLLINFFELLNNDIWLVNFSLCRPKFIHFWRVDTEIKFDEFFSSLPIQAFTPSLSVGARQTFNFGEDAKNSRS